MASSSGNSSNSTKLIQSCSSEENLQILMDQRKRKRKQSNRESAKRSRMRKQQHMNDLVAEVELLKKENSEILLRLNATTQHYVQVEAQNCILRAQTVELSQRLQSLNDIISFINNNSKSTEIYQTDCYLSSEDFFMNNNNLMNMGHLNQPIMACADIFQW